MRNKQSKEASKRAGGRAGCRRLAWVPAGLFFSGITSLHFFRHRSFFSFSFFRVLRFAFRLLIIYFLYVWVLHRCPSVATPVAWYIEQHS